MSKDLSIVIPRYRETERDIFPLLASVNGQVGVNFQDIEVIVASDGGGPGELDGDFLSLFDFETRQVTLGTNCGPGAARQAGLDAAKGDYVMFCDADDTLHSVGVLGAVLQEAKTSASDMLSTEWLEECQAPDGGFTYLTHQIENTWMHGKLLRREFLRQNNIRFHEELRVHEDSYFLCLAKTFSKRDRHLPITSYVWKFHRDSITRRNNSSYTFDSFPTFILACSLAHKEIEGRCPYEFMEYKAVQLIIYVYFSLHRPEWSMPENRPYLEASEKMFAEQTATFWHYWDDAPKNRITEIYNEERQKNFAGCMETETIEQWIRRMRENTN